MQITKNNEKSPNVIKSHLVKWNILVITKNHEHQGAFHTGPARARLRNFWAELYLSLQGEQSSALIFSAGLEFLIRAAGCSH